MSFQWIIDYAETLSIDSKKQIAISQARDGITRAVSRGTPPRRIEVKLPDGLPWDEFRGAIQAAEALDRITTATITISDPGYAWYYGGTMPAEPQTFTVRCIQFPNWVLMARNQVAWSGPFVFVEV
jgi:hypothetical protein